MLPSVHRVLAASAAETFDDPVNARTIHLVAFGLIVVALVLVGVTAWWWVASRVEHPSLGPLEVMGTTRWRTSDDGLRRVRLDAARPVDAPEPVEVADERPGRFVTPPASSAPRDPLLQARRSD